MGFYARFILPRLVDRTCRQKPQMRQRAKIVPAASGRVLEIGFGSGLNLGFYDQSAVRHLYALDPSDEMWRRARDRVRAAGLPVEFLKAGAEEIPIDDRSVDTVVVTYTLCTLPDTSAALREIARVLAPGGALLFCEHGAAPDARTLRWQRRLDPIWSRFSGGCHLDRPIPALLEQGGFRATDLSAMYVPGWKPASFNYWGTAVPAP